MDLQLLYPDGEGIYPLLQQRQLEEALKEKNSRANVIYLIVLRGVNLD